MMLSLILIPVEKTLNKVSKIVLKYSQENLTLVFAKTDF